MHVPIHFVLNRLICVALSQMEKRHAAAVAASGGILEVDEDFDARAVAKRKMLGNIKFIGELGKLQVRVISSFLIRFNYK